MEGAEEDALAAVCQGSEAAALGMQPVDDERLEAAAQAGAEPAPVRVPAVVSVEEATGSLVVMVTCSKCGQEVVQSRMTTHRKSKACQSSATATLTQVDGEGAEVAGGAAGSLACPHSGCAKVCPNLKALRKHFQAVHSETRHSCAVCGKSFGRTDLLSRHRKTCGIDKQFACVCAPLKPFKTVHNLKRHIAQAVDKGFPGVHRLLVPEGDAAMPEEAQEGQQEGMAPEAEQLEGL